MSKQARFVLIASSLVLLATAAIWLFFGRGAVPVSSSSGDNPGAVSTEAEPTAGTSSESSSEPAATESAAAPESTSTPETTRLYVPLTFPQTRAMWIAYLDFQQLTMGTGEEQFRSVFTEMLENCTSLSINTLYVQVRPFADAMYASDIFPWSKYASGTQGVDPGYDPLAVMLELAHTRGIAIHAWINPLRISRDANAVFSADNIGVEYQKRGDGLVGEVDGGLYFNPACEEVVQLICNGVEELCKKYDIDGVQFDDYFYPTTDESFDADQYADYQSTGGTLSLDDWRRQNIDSLVQRVYEVCHTYNLPFGISPSGNIDYSYYTMYANVARWLNEPGFVDYIVPQIYWGFENETRPFTKTLETWQTLITGDVELITGLAAYKIDTKDGNDEWIDSHDILSRQAACCDSHNSGWAVFRYASLFEPEPSVHTAVLEELSAFRAHLGLEE